MPRRLPPHRHFDHNRLREILVAKTPGIDIAAGPITVRASALPLFRRGSTSELEQAIRVLVTAPVETTVVASVRAGARIVDRFDGPVPSGTTPIHLFVPEVTAPATFTIVLSTGGSAPVTAEIVVEPQRKWSIYLVHHSHFDYGYTDPQAIVMANQLAYIDAALDLIAATDDWEDDARFRWNIEVTYPLQKWLAARGSADRDELIRRVNEGRIEIHALPFSMHTEVYSIDELAWGLKFTDELRERYGLDILTAIQSDVPGATIGLLNLLTAADIRYFNVAHNYAGRSVPFRHGGQDLTRPFWWQGADGKRLLTWFTDTPDGLAYMDGAFVGLSTSEPVARGLLPDYLQALANRPYPYDKEVFGWNGFPDDLELTKQPYPHDILHFRVQNTPADNAPPGLQVSETVRDWNERWAFPRLRVATNRDFFEEAEHRLGDRIDTFEGDWTDWWVDGVGSAALPLGLNRRAQAALRVAQTLHTLADTQSGEAIPAIPDEIERAYESVALFDEHTWGSANPWHAKLEQHDSGALQWAAKSAFAYQGFDQANALLASGLHRFAAPLRPAPDALASLLVFNPSGWRRTDLVRLFLPAERVRLDTPFAVIDATTGARVPHTIEPQPNPAFRAKGQWLLFAATDLPAAGFARFDIVAAPESASANTSAADPYLLESPFYRVRIDPKDGFIASITDLESGRELVDQNAPFGFNEYIYDRYGTAAGFNHLSGRIVVEDLNLFGSRSTAGNASLVSRTSDPVRDSITVRLVAEGSDGLEVTISLPRAVKRIDFSNRLFKHTTMDKESGYFAFPFAVADPDPEYEITGGVSSKQAPHVPGSAGYMLAIRHWIALRDDLGSAALAALEAPLVEIGTIALPYSPFPSTLPADRINPSTIYSWAHNNLWDTNFPPQQGGEMYFRYSIASDSGDTGRDLAHRTAATFSAPLAGVALGRLGTKDAPANGSFIEISHPLVELVSIAPARHGDGIVAFLHSLAPSPIETEITFPNFPITSAQLATHLERHPENLPLTNHSTTLTLSPGAYVSLVLTLADRDGIA